LRRLFPPERTAAFFRSPQVRSAAFVSFIAALSAWLLYDTVFHSAPAPGYRRTWTDMAVLDSDRGSGAAPSLPNLSGGAELLPVSVGARWMSDGTTPDGEALTLETTVASAEPVPGGVEAVFASRFLMKLRTPQRLTERYRIDAAGITGVATGENGDVRLDPPLPLVRFPVRQGALQNWSGRLIPPQGAPIPATAVCRVDGPDTVRTQAGDYPAYRLDMQVRVGEHPESQPARVSTIYLAPGVGFVRQEIGQMPGVTSLTLRRFMPPAVGGPP
jgi:hypothetical protein